MQNIISSPGMFTTGVALILIFGMPWMDYAGMQRLKQRTSGPGRLAMYRYLTLLLWGAAALALLAASPNRLLTTPAMPGEMNWLLGQLVLSRLLLVLLLVFYAYTVISAIKIGRNKALRSRIARHFSRMQFILPVSLLERRWWVAVSLSAGICEEILYRGYLMEFLRGHVAGGTTLGLTAALLLSSVAFSFGHLYQGLKGMLATGLNGLLLGLLAVVSGGLIVPIVVHALLDLRILWLYHPQQDAPELAEQLIAGCGGEASA